MSKTIKQWLEELPSPYREQALKAVSPAKANLPCTRMSYAIVYGFEWNQTPQGDHYWGELFDKYFN